MIIANPIYDVVFKQLMEDRRTAKFFIECLIEETIEELEVKPQEQTYTKELLGIAILRMDFIATIKTKEGGHKNILIEIQKARNPIDVMRFRNYLAEQYKKQDEIKIEGEKVLTELPIVTIYLLGFTLPELDEAAIKVNRQYTGLLSRKILNVKSDFIEKLTHDCYVVQLPRIKAKLQTRLEKMLSVFEQDFFVDNSHTLKEYEYNIDDSQIQAMIDILHFAGTNPKRKKEIENEKEAFRVFELALFQQSQEDKKAIKELSEALEEKDIALEQERKANEGKDKALAESAKLIEELKRQLGKNKPD